MSLRLSWKVFLAFWSAIVLTAVIPLTLVTLEGRPPNPEAVRKERIRSAIVVMNVAGRKTAEHAIRNWPQRDRQEFALVADSQIHPVLTLLAPADPTFVGLRLLAINVSVGLICSIFVAVYLTRPLVWLRDGFRQIADGHLDTRLVQLAGRRRDEIADLARDFDKMAARLQRLVATRERILHDLSHELRSPLARQRVAIGLARQNSDRADEALSRIEVETDRLSLILGNFLTLSRMESGAEVETVYFDIGELLRVICEDARFEAQARMVDVQLSLAPPLEQTEELRVMSGAPELLRQALDNILRNALRFTPQHGTVWVSAYVANCRLWIDVCDEGPGVPSGMIETIFNPFVKGPAESGGIGLGLAIAQRAVRAHQGNLHASNLPGRGLRMRMDLPCPTTASRIAPNVQQRGN